MSGFFGSDFDQNVPSELAQVSGGASEIRDVKTRIKTFLAVCFDLEDGTLLQDVVDAILPPAGDAGTILTSAGVGSPPQWLPPPALPIGGGCEWYSATLPAGFLWCRGGTATIADYPALAAVLGTTWGGNGTTTFGLPDIRGRAPVGVGTGTAADATAWGLAAARGAETHALVAAENGPHTHTLPNNGSAQAGSDNGGAACAAVTNGSTTARSNGSTNSGGSGTAHNNIQPSLGVNFIIYAGA